MLVPPKKSGLPACLIAAALLCSPLTAAVAAPPTGPTGSAAAQSAPARATLDRTPTSRTGTVEKSTDRFIVTFTDGTDAAQKDEVLDQATQSAGLEDPEILKEASDGADVVDAGKDLDAAQQQQVVRDLEADPHVADAEPDLRIQNAQAGYPATPNDSLYASYQWNIRNIGANQAWQYSTGVGQTIGVVDSGITSHSELNQKTVAGYDFVSGDYDRDGTGGRDADPTDPGVLNALENWHGTHVAGIAASATHNASGVAGVAPDAKVQPVRAFGTGASGYVSDFADAITWASGGSVPGVAKNARPSTVVNFSAAWGGTCPSILKSAIDGAHSRNVPVVVAAGNSGISADGVAPANCLGSIVVGASARSNVMTGYSNYGAMLDVLAPGGTTGDDVWSTYNTGYDAPAQQTYGMLNGTSMAAPHVAATIAMMKQRNPSLDVETIRSLLVGTGTRISGYAKVDAAKAVSAVSVAASSGGTSTTSLAQAAAAPRVVAGIKAFYDSHGGSAAFGAPLYNERSGLRDGGVYQGFAKNRTIYWSPFTGTHSVNWSGAIGAKYRAEGYENAYGYPSSEEISAQGYAYQWFRTAGGKSTLMMWTPSTGSHAIVENSGNGGSWIRDGRESGAGFPVADEVACGKGSCQSFTRQGKVSTYVWTAATGSHRVLEHGAIGGSWVKAGRQNGWGYPTTDEFKGSDGRIHQKFSKGVEATWTAKEGLHRIK